VGRVLSFENLDGDADLIHYMGRPHQLGRQSRGQAESPV